MCKTIVQQRLVLLAQTFKELEPVPKVPSEQYTDIIIQLIGTNLEFFWTSLKMQKGRIRQINEVKGTFLRDFQCLQMILKERAWAPGVPLKVYFLFYFLHFYIVFLSFKTN